MSSPAIDKYYTSVQKIRDYGGSGKETAIRSAFYTLLNHYAEKMDLILITELSVEGKLGRKVTPDGTLKNALRLDYGYWESKDEADEELDGLILLKGIPTEAWAYKLGNRSTLEWVLDQYKEKTPKAPTIREKFNTYRFADYKEQVIDLLKRVTTVSVGTMEVVRGMEKAER